MKLLFRSVQIVDKQSVYHTQTKDLLIENGTIAAIGENLEAGKARVIEAEGLHASPGWLDMRTGLRDPGREQDESLASLREVAAKGGFTGLTLMPNTHPTVDSKGMLNYLLRESQSGAVEFFPTATVTKGAEGNDFTEMIDLHQAGAAAFTDGVNPLHNSDILLKSLQYLRPLNALLINRPEDQYLSLYGQMHEGVTSTLLGLKGIPSLAEEMMIIRDLKLLEYALEGADLSTFSAPVLHFAMLSTQKSVALIREAKKKSLPVSCDVAAHQFAFEDEALMGFDTNLKVNPPFRGHADRLALKRGLADGTIDAIVSDHAPHAPQNKETEFDHAEFGITALETTFSVARMYSGADLETIVNGLTISPRRILRLPQVTVAEGAAANLTFFSPDKLWKFTKSLSLSNNSPFLNEELKGVVNGVFNRGELIWFQQV